MKKQTVSYQGFKLEGNFREMALLECSDVSLVNKKWLALNRYLQRFWLGSGSAQPDPTRPTYKLDSVRF